MVLYLCREQFWGRAVRASRDSLNPGRFLFWPRKLRLSKPENFNFLPLVRNHASISSVQNDLVLPTFSSRNCKWRCVFHGVGESIYLASVGEMIRDIFGCNEIAIPPQLDVNCAIDGETILRSQRSFTPNELQRSAIRSPRRNHYCRQSSSSKFEHESGGRFH